MMDIVGGRWRCGMIIIETETMAMRDDRRRDWIDGGVG